MFVGGILELCVFSGLVWFGVRKLGLTLENESFFRRQSTGE
jgi:hypothetical protein